MNHEITWAVELSFLLGFIFVVHYLCKKAFSSSKTKEPLKEKEWKQSVQYEALKSLRILGWILLTTFLAEFFIRYFGLQNKISFIAPLRNVAMISCTAWSLFRLKTIFQQVAISRRALGKPSLEPGSIETLGKLFTILILFISLSLSLQIFGFDISLFITFGGIGVAALAFATKDIIGNFYGGLMIQMARSFTINDRIELPQKKISGTVEKIGWYSTTIRDSKKRPIYIPNALFATECIINSSHITHGCIEETLYIQWDNVEKIDHLVHEIRQFLSLHPTIDAKQSFHVYITAFCPLSVHLHIKAYTYTTHHEKLLEVKHSILFKISMLVKKNKAFDKITEGIVQKGGIPVICQLSIIPEGVSAVGIQSIGSVVAPLPEEGSADSAPESAE